MVQNAFCPTRLFHHWSPTKETGLATRIVDAGMTFLKCYAKLASAVHKLGRPLFVYRPKLHYYHHILLDMRRLASQGHRPLNPISYSCSQAEDFIGRASLLSRRVAAGHCQKRVLQRYLAGAFQVWQQDRPTPGWLGSRAHKSSSSAEDVGHTTCGGRGRDGGSPNWWCLTS